MPQGQTATKTPGRDLCEEIGLEYCWGTTEAPAQTKLGGDNSTMCSTATTLAKKLVGEQEVAF